MRNQIKITSDEWSEYRALKKHASEVSSADLIADLCDLWEHFATYSCHEALGTPYKLGWEDGYSEARNRLGAIISKHSDNSKSEEPSK